MRAVRAAIVLLVILFLVYVLYVFYHVYRAIRPAACKKKYVPIIVPLKFGSPGRFNRCRKYESPSRTIYRTLSLKPRELPSSFLQIAEIMNEDTYPTSVRVHPTQPQVCMAWATTPSNEETDPLYRFPQELSVPENQYLVLSAEEYSIRDIDYRLGWSTRYNVHDAGVIATGRALVTNVKSKTSNYFLDEVSLNERCSRVVDMSYVSPELKQTAKEQIAHIIHVNGVSRYDAMTEVELLELVLEQIKDHPEHFDYFTYNLADMKDVCLQGRASRLVDCIAMAHNEYIIPEAVIKQQLMDTLYDITTKNNDQEVIRRLFAQELNTKVEQSVISREYANEYSSWTD